MSRLLKIGSLELHVFVEPLVGGGFTYVCVEIDRGGPQIDRTRFESSVQYESERAAYAGGLAYARKQGRGLPH